MKEASVLSSAALNFSCIAYSLDDILDVLDPPDLLETDDFDLEPKYLEPTSLLTPFSPFLFLSMSCDVYSLVQVSLFHLAELLLNAFHSKHHLLG